jgi:hypothetical protein
MKQAERHKWHQHTIYIRITVYNLPDTGHNSCNRMLQYALVLLLSNLGGINTSFDIDWLNCSCGCIRVWHRCLPLSYTWCELLKDRDQVVTKVSAEITIVGRVWIHWDVPCEPSISKRSENQPCIYVRLRHLPSKISKFGFPLQRTLCLLGSLIQEFTKTFVLLQSKSGPRLFLVKRIGGCLNLQNLRVSSFIYW